MHGPARTPAAHSSSRLCCPSGLSSTVINVSPKKEDDETGDAFRVLSDGLLLPVRTPRWGVPEALAYGLQESELRHRFRENTVLLNPGGVAQAIHPGAR